MSNKKTYKVYIHTAPNGDVYVGVTCMDKLYNRWQPSLYQTTALQPYIDKFGWDNIKHEVINTTTDREEAYKKEDELIQYYKEKGVLINKQRSGLICAKDENAYDRQRKKEKYTNDPEYRDKVKERSRQWREANPDYDSKYYQDHKEEISEYQRQYREEHKEERVAYQQQYNKDHKEERSAYLRQWRAKKKSDKELTMMAEADLKRINSDYTISLMNEIIQFRKMTINNFL